MIPNAVPRNSAGVESTTRAAKIPCVGAIGAEDFSPAPRAGRYKTRPTESRE